MANRHDQAGRRVRGAAVVFLSLGVVAASLLAAPAAAVVGPSRPVPLVRLPFPQEDGSLTPYTFELGYPLVTLVYDTLLWRDTSGVPQPWLAQSIDTSADGRRLTVRLADARWQDGPPVTADDVAFTFGYVASHRHPRFTPELEAVDHVDAVDTRTAVISLRHAAPGFRDQPLADLPILPAHLWRGLGPSQVAPPGLPVGSGPYRLVEHTVDTSYRFEAFDGYFRGPPAVRALDVPIMGDATKTIAALDRHDVDMLPVSLPESAAAGVDRVDTRVLKGPAYAGTVLLFNVRTPPLDRTEVRQALSRSLDLGRIARAAGRDAVPADRGYVHPESPWATTDVLHSYQPGEAEATLAAAGLNAVKIVVPDNDPIRQAAGREVVLALAGVHVRAELTPLSSDALGRAIGEDGSDPSFQLAIAAEPALTSYDPDFLRRLFGSPPADGALNYSGYRSAAFDDLARRIASTPDPAARRAAVADALRLLAADAPAVPLFFADGAFAFRPAVYDGWIFIKGAGIFDKRSFVEPAPATQVAARPVVPEAPARPFPFGKAALAVFAVVVALAVGAAVSSVRGAARRR